MSQFGTLSLEEGAEATVKGQTYYKSRMELRRMILEDWQPSKIAR
jgi:hypothetical protein